VLEDVFGTRTTINKVFEIFKREGAGILVYLQEGAAGVPAGQITAEKSGSAQQRQQSWRLTQPVGVERPVGVEQAVKSNQKLGAINTTLVQVAKIGAF
jgi:hypothetical protein